MCICSFHWPYLSICTNIYWNIDVLRDNQKENKKTLESKTDDGTKNYALIIAKRSFAKKRFLRRRIGANIRNIVVNHTNMNLTDGNRDSF